MSHFTSPQAPSGSPAMLGDPQAPLNWDEVEDEPAGGVVPVEPPVLEGPVGVRSVVLFSIAQPVARVDASRNPKRNRFFMGLPLQFCIGTRDACVYPGSRSPHCKEFGESA